MPRDEAFWQSVKGTVFRDLAGNYISEVGKPWSNGKPVGIVTAWNPFFTQAPAEQNQQANAALKRVLAERGCVFEEINAWHPDESAYEHSYAVEGLSHEQAHELCRAFEQGGYFWASASGPVELALCADLTSNL